MLYVYDLTPLTMKANTGRRVIIQGFDLPRRGLILGVSGFVVTMLPASLAYSLLGATGIFVHMVLLGLWFWLIEARSRDGLRLPLYKSIIERKFDSVTNTYIRCWRPIEDQADQYCWLRTSSVPAPSEVRHG